MYGDRKRELAFCMCGIIVLTVIRVKFLMAASIDIVTASLYYFCKKCLGTERRICNLILVLCWCFLQLEQLAFLLVTRQKEGGAFSRMLAGSDKHVVLCATTVRPTMLIDFLNEFYADGRLQV